MTWLSPKDPAKTPRDPGADDDDRSPAATTSLSNANRARLDRIAKSDSLTTLNAISIGLLALGVVLFVIGLAASGAVVVYLGCVLFGFGASTGILALAVNAIVGAIARAKIE